MILTLFVFFLYFWCSFPAVYFTTPVLLFEALGLAFLAVTMPVGGIVVGPNTVRFRRFPFHATEWDALTARHLYKTSRRTTRTISNYSNYVAVREHFISCPLDLRPSRPRSTVRTGPLYFPVANALVKIAGAPDPNFPEEPDFFFSLCRSKG